MFRFTLEDGKKYSIQFKYTKLDNGKRLTTAIMDIFLPEEQKFFPIARANKSVNEQSFSRHSARKTALQKLVKNLRDRNVLSVEDSRTIWNSYKIMSNGRW